MDEQRVLEQLGFSESEVKVYLASLLLGSSSASQIAIKAGLLRTSTYEILKSLTNKGLISSVLKGRINYFQAASPDQLLKVLEEKKMHLEQVLPKLMKLQRAVIEKPTVEFYEGKNGLKTILEDVLKHAGQRYLVVGNNTKFRSLLPEFYLKSFLRKRLAAHVLCQRIAEDSPETRELRKRDSQEQRITKTLESLQNADAELFMYADRIAIFTLVHNHPLGIIFKEKKISKLLEIIFNNVWDHQD